MFMDFSSDVKMRQHISVWKSHGAKGTVKRDATFKEGNADFDCTLNFSKVNSYQLPAFKMKVLGFLGGAVVDNLPANAGHTGSRPGLGRSHVLQSSWAREPQLLSLRVWSLCSATREAAIVRGPCTAMKSGPRLPQLEKALTQKWRPNTAINK